MFCWFRIGNTKTETDERAIVHLQNRLPRPLIVAYWIAQKGTNVADARHAKISADSYYFTFEWIAHEKALFYYGNDAE